MNDPRSHFHPFKMPWSDDFDITHAEILLPDITAENIITMPNDVFRQLIGFVCTFTVNGGLSVRNTQTVHRRGDRIYGGWGHNWPGGVAPPSTILAAAEITEQLLKFGQIQQLSRMPTSLYLYPGDTLTLTFQSSSLGDEYSFARYIFREWPFIE